MEGIEIVRGPGDEVLCYIVRRNAAPSKTTFITPPTAQMQFGFVVYPAGAKIPYHSHKPVNRSVTGTPEMLLVRKGACLADIGDQEGNIVGTHSLAEGDVIVLLGGSHGFRLQQDTILLEIKQGPYAGTDDKVRLE